MYIYFLINWIKNKFCDKFMNYNMQMQLIYSVKIVIVQNYKICLDLIVIFMINFVMSFIILLYFKLYFLVSFYWLDESEFDYVNWNEEEFSDSLLS